jgi:hypothetical protein
MEVSTIPNPGYISLSEPDLPGWTLQSIRHLCMVPVPLILFSYDAKSQQGSRNDQKPKWYQSVTENTRVNDSKSRVENERRKIPAGYFGVSVMVRF